MVKESWQQANDHVNFCVNTQYATAVDRMCDFNERNYDDNPHAIAEELNSLLPWVYETPGFHYEVIDGFIIGVADD